MKTNLIGISGKMGSGKDTAGIIMQYLSSRNNLTGSQKEYLKDLKYLSHILGKKGKYKIKKYADKLKDIACLLIGCTREQLEDREFKEKPLGPEWMKWFTEDGLAPKDNNAGVGEVLTPRKLLQLLGTECGRDIIHPNIWVNALFADFENNKSEWLSGLNSKWIITDVRFPNEAQAIKDRGGVVIRVNRPCPECKVIEGHKFGCLTYKKLIEHPSETALDNYDFDHVIENDGSIEDLLEKVKQLKLV
jgi:hypothetical protein